MSLTGQKRASAGRLILEASTGVLGDSAKELAGITCDLLAELDEIEKQASMYQWIVNNCEVTYNGETIYDEEQLKGYMEE